MVETPTMNVGESIADEAVSALHDTAFTGVPGFCQQFARQVVQRACGNIFDGYWRGSALATMQAFRGTHYSIWEARDGNALPALQEGDLLYKGQVTSGPFGHVGIVANGRRVGLPSTVVVVIENSSYHVNPENMGDVSGGKGYRTLDVFGPFEEVVRL